MKHKHPNTKLVIACSQQIEGVPEVIPLVPLGDVRSQKGDFTVDQESYAEMCKWFDTRGIDIVIDYEHQTLKDVQAPAGGWIKELILNDQAICGRVEWTPKATEYLKNKEYRYLSPVVMVRQTDKKAVRLPSVALTNAPAIDGMFPIINSEFYDEGEDTMDFLKQLIALLGLAETATEADVAAAIQKLQDDTKVLKEKECQTVANKTILTLLDLKDGASTAEVTAKIAAIQNPAGFVPVEQYNLLATKLAGQEGASLVEQALKDGKITPAQKQWAEQYALSDKAGFEQFLKIAQPVVPMAQLPVSGNPAKKPAGLDPVICKQLGITTADIEKFGKDEQ